MRHAISKLGAKNEQRMGGTSTTQPIISGSRTLSEANGRSGIIFDVKRYAIHDGPGIRTTVFFKGCPLQCGWCHNPESWREGPEHSLRTSRCIGCGRCVEACPHGAISGTGEPSTTDPSKCVLCGACVEACPAGAREILGCLLTVEQVLAQIERDVVFYDESDGGVTFSGGEPLSQAAFLGKLLAECKAREIHTAVDTTCHAPWEVVEAVAEHVDLFLIDIKHMDPAIHERFTGVSNDLILQNSRRLAQREKEIIIRIPLVPGVNDDDENIAATGEFVSSLGGVTRIDVLPHNEAARGKLGRLTQGHELLQVEPPAAERIQAIVQQLEQSGFTVKIGG